MNLPINPELISVIESLELDVDEALIFCFCVTYYKQRPGLLDMLIDKGVINSDNDPIYRINLTTLDEDGTLTLRIPMYGRDTSNFLFEEYIQKLLSTGFELTGYSTNMQKYTVLTTDADTKDNFNRLTMLVPNFSVDKLVAATQKYYEQTETAKNLRNFLATDAEMAYRTS